MKSYQKEEQKNDVKLPFILNFLEKYEGAMASTTSGNYDDPDASDRDS